MKITIKQLKSLIKEAVMEMGQQPAQKGAALLSTDEISDIIHDVLDSYRGNPKDAVDAFNKALMNVQPHGLATGQAPEGLTRMHEATLKKLIRGVVKETTKKKGTQKK